VSRCQRIKTFFVLIPKTKDAEKLSGEQVITLLWLTGWLLKQTRRGLRAGVGALKRGDML
jgi:hypothetical protein